MLSSRDYLVRQIEQLSSMLAVVLGLKREQKPQHAEYTIDEYLKRVYGLSLRLLRSLPERELIRMCDTGDLAGREKLYSLAMLLKEDGDLQQMLASRDDAFAVRLKALGLLLAYDENADAEDAGEASEPIAKLLNELRDYELPFETAVGVWRHYERIGRYADAENELFDQLGQLHSNDDPRVEGVIADGREFYERLLKLDDRTLIDGNLPRAEIVDAVRELQNFRKR